MRLTQIRCKYFFMEYVIYYIIDNCSCQNKASQAEGHEFESRLPLQLKIKQLSNN